MCTESSYSHIGGICKHPMPRQRHAQPVRQLPAFSRPEAGAQASNRYLRAEFHHAV